MLQRLVDDGTHAVRLDSSESVHDGSATGDTVEFLHVPIFCNRTHKPTEETVKRNQTFVSIY